MYNTKQNTMGCSSCNGLGEILPCAHQARKGTPEWDAELAACNAIQANYDAALAKVGLTTTKPNTSVTSTSTTVTAPKTNTTTGNGILTTPTGTPAVPVAVNDPTKILGIKKEYVYIGGAVIVAAIAWKKFK